MLNNFYKQPRRYIGQWLWPLFSLLSLLPCVIAGRWQDLPSITFLGVLGFLIGFVNLREKQLQQLCLVLLSILVSLGVTGQVMAARVWQNSSRSSFMSLFRALDEDHLQGVNTRSWRVPEQTETLTLTFEAKLLEGQTGWQWFASSRQLKLQPMREADKQFTRVTIPAGVTTYPMRTFGFTQPIAEQTFKVEMQLRSSQPIAAEGCRGIWLHVWDESQGASCLGVALSPDWQTFSHTWTTPPTTTSQVIRIIINGFAGISYDIADTKLYLQTATAWKELKPLLPGVPALSSSWAPPELGSGQGFEPTSTWQTYTFTSHKPAHSTSGDNLFSVTLSVPERVTVATRNVKLSVPATPVADGIRQSYIFGHPNLAGHTVTTLTLIALALSSALPWQLVISALGFVACYFTGSRSAWLVLLVGVAVLLWLKQPRRRTWLIIFYAIVAVALALGWSYLGRLQITSVTNASSRPEIWQTSLAVARDYFWLGIGTSPQRFSDLWFTYNTKAIEAVTHAHNIVLEWLVNFGILGGVAVIWLFIGFFRIAWPRKGVIGVSIVTALLALNTTDVSLFYTWVLVPFLLYLNAKE